MCTVYTHAYRKVHVRIYVHFISSSIPTYIHARPFPIDMAGFAVRVEILLTKPDVWVGFERSGEPTQVGYLETSFLENFATRNTAECRGNNREVCTK